MSAVCLPLASCLLLLEAGGVTDLNVSEFYVWCYDLARAALATVVALLPVSRHAGEFAGMSSLNMILKLGANVKEGSNG